MPVDPQHHARLYATIDHLTDGNKGLLAADESTNSANKRLASLDIPTTSESRRKWRELLFTTPELEDFISGVILYDETIQQMDSTGRPFTKALADKGILPGIKVDLGLIELTNFPNETFTQGLDDLDNRLKDYYRMGARFAKWRAAFTIGTDTPSEAAIHANGNVLGLYASICQRNGIVPIIEPEVLYEGSHSLQQAKSVTKEVLSTILAIVAAYKVDLRGIIVKTSMVLAGNQHSVQSTPTEVAHATLETLNQAVPKQVGAVVFLSGGQSPQQATANFNAIGQLIQQHKQHWPITYSFSRAVQDPAMKAWQGNAADVTKAQNIFYHRLACNSAAHDGAYSDHMEIFPS